MNSPKSRLMADYFRMRYLVTALNTTHSALRHRARRDGVASWRDNHGRAYYPRKYAEELQAVYNNGYRLTGGGKWICPGINALEGDDAQVALELMDRLWGNATE
jgi:hypothetical protein